MGDRMTPIPFDQLMGWILEENEKYGKIFGVNHTFKSEDGKKLELFGEKIETPYGPAAGPHTQLAQNIIAAYVTGSRFFELKTVQTLDGEDLPVSKPCINASDECYNVEWSTELTVPQAFDEYAKAWFALKLLSKEFGFGDPDGFVFNMSVGYDFKGITSEKIDRFIMSLKEAKDTEIWNVCKNWALEHIGEFKNIDKNYVETISSEICRSITLSTLHGCPASEIQKIAEYLISKKGLNTFVKCNPTLLGYEFARETLDKMGYDYISFDDHHFKEDLQYADAVKMIKEMQELASKNGVIFGVKLTNTFPVEIKRDELPGEEMYMSGKTLYPLTTELARRLSKEFDGKIKISYSGGADFFNIDKLFDTGIWPITIATTLLKNGGYQRGVQIAKKLKAMDYASKYEMDNDKLQSLANQTLEDEKHKKAIKPIPRRKLDTKVPLVDCFIASCKEGCPIHQDIPEYIHLVSEGKHYEALKVITKKNPLPFITGTICSHACMNKCSRQFCDESVHIRDIKLEAAKGAYDKLLGEIKKGSQKGSSVAIIGGGTTGIAASHLLAREGMKVTVFEKKNELGGIVRQVIPEFRIGSESIANDIKLAEKLGVEFVTGSEQNSVKDLKAKGFDHVIFAIGAWKPGRVRLEGQDPMNVIEFLEKIKNTPSEMNLGKNVAIIGGGNTAMDAARAAKRANGVENVSLVYRRTKKYMPADAEELGLALEDGVEFKELLSPIRYENGKLTCEIMKLGDLDEKGRRRPVGTGENKELEVDTLIAAVGEKIDTDLYTKNGIELNEKGFARVDANSLETNVENVYVAGDGLNGPATVVEGIADATKIARVIVEKTENRAMDLSVEKIQGTRADAISRKGILEMGQASGECNRCLQCSTVCETCVDVCPNRANVSVKIKGNDTRQIVHVDKMCNECGNCETFCPYDSAPYKEKFTLFANEADFANSENTGFCVKGDMQVKVRYEENEFDVNLNDSHINLPKDIENIIRAVIEDYAYMI